MYQLARLRRLFGLFLVAGVFVCIFNVVPQQAWAADPGCYERSAGDMKTSKADCPEAEAAGVAAGKCYFRQIVPRQVSAYEERRCVDITVSTTSSGNDDAFYVANDCNESEVTDDNCGVLNILVTFINVLSALVGVLIVGVIIWGGIQYSAAESDPQKVKAAKGKIFNAILALFVFIFMYSFLQWIVPGGIF